MKHLLIFLAVVSAFSFSSAQETNRRGPRRVGDLHAEDLDRVRTRIHTLQFTTFGFGPATAQNAGNNDMFYSAFLGKNWDVNENAEIRGDLFAALPSKGSGAMFMGALGGSFFFSTTDISPLLGAELGFGSAKGEGDAVTGFAGEVHAGVRFFRTAETQMSVEGFYRTIFATGSPSLIGAQLAIHF